MFIFQNSALSHAQTFIDVLARTAEHQLLQYDNLLVIDDVIKGRKSNMQTAIILSYPLTVQLQYYILHLWNFPFNIGVESPKYPTSELIRRKNAGLPLEDDEDKGALPRGKNTWPGEKIAAMNYLAYKSIWKTWRAK